MSGFRRSLGSSIGRKWLIAIGGLLLCLFLIVHLAGNLFLYAGAESYNDYSETLHANEGLLLVAEIGLLAVFALHIGVAILNARKNRAARSDPYAVSATKQDAGLNKAAPRNWMFLSGSIVLAFLVLHLADFRFEARPDINYEGRTPFEKAVTVLQSPLSAILYVVGTIVLAIHLSHGFASAFQTLGISHPRLAKPILYSGYAFSVLIGVGFVSFVFWAMLR